MSLDPLPPTSPRAVYWQLLQSRLSLLQKFDSWLFLEVNRIPHPPALNTFMHWLAIVMNRGDGWLFGLVVFALWDRFLGAEQGLASALAFYPSPLADNRYG